MTIILQCSCEKASSVSEKHVGDWEGLLYVTLSEPFPDNRFKSLETPDGLRLQSSEFLIDLKKSHIPHADELRYNGQEH